VFGSFNNGMNIQLQLKGLFGCSVRHTWVDGNSDLFSQEVGLNLRPETSYQIG